MLSTIRLLPRYVLLIFLYFSTGYAVAEVDERLQAAGWDELIFEKKLSNHFTAGDQGGIKVVSQGSVSLLKMPLAIDVETQPTLRWRWCVTKAAPATDLSVRGSDDRSLAIYVAFPFVAEEATAFELIERKIVESTAGKDAPGRVLMYVWGGDADRGTIVKSPHLGSSGMMTILRSAETPTGQWFSEAINIADDYERTFGTPPPDPLYIAIGADTDDTEGIAEGTVMNLEFVGPDRLF